MEDENDFLSGQRNALPVMVEYEFFNVPSSCLEQLPERVTRAVNTLVRRQRVPSDEDVRELVQEEEEEEEEEEDAELFGSGSAESLYVVSESTHTTEPARVRVMLPHNVAVELALHRSFQEGGNVEQRAALTEAQVRTLSRRSQLIQLRQLRRRQEEILSPRGARRALERRRISPAASTCVICLERVRQSRDRIFLDPCGHVFHRDCIVQWLEKLPRQCPTCRVDVNLTPLVGVMTRSQTRALGESNNVQDASETLLL